MTWKLSTAKGETMEMQMAFPDVPATNANILNAQLLKGMLGSEIRKEETRLVGSWFSSTV